MHPGAGNGAKARLESDDDDGGCGRDRDHDCPCDAGFRIQPASQLYLLRAAGLEHMHVRSIDGNTERCDGGNNDADSYYECVDRNAEPACAD